MEFNHKRLCNETWETSNMMNLAPKARLEDHMFERSKPLKRIDDQGIKLPSYDKLLNAFGASCKKSTPRPKSTNDLTFFGLDSFRCNKASSQCEEEQAYASTAKAKSISILQDNFMKPFSWAREDRSCKDRHPHQRIDKLQSFLATHQAAEPPKNNNTNSADMAELDESLADFLIMMRNHREKGHCGSPLNAQCNSKHTPQHDSKSQEDFKTLKMDSPISSKSNPDQPLKSILLCPKYSNKSLSSNRSYSSGTLVRDDAEKETKSVRRRSESSVHFTAPTVRFIQRDRQNSGWYTREDEQKMIRKLKRAKQRRLEKRLGNKETANQSLLTSCTQNEDNAESES